MQHRRQPALGKAMPVTTLLLNLERANHNVRLQHDAEAADDDDDRPPRYFDTLAEPPSPDDDRDAPDPAHYAEDHLLGNANDQTPCLNCTRRGANEYGSGAGGTINEMCQLLCNDQCRQQGLSLCGQQVAQDRGQQQRPMAFLRQYDVAEALAKTSAMTSTSQMKQRLAARKLEMEIEADQAEQAAAGQATPRLAIDIDDDVGAAAAAGAAASACSKTVRAAAVAGDTVPPSVDHEMPPPRDLLLYLVR